MTHTVRRDERGFSLIVSLILLVLITLVALASMRSVAMQARMTATTFDRSLAFQAAETALRDAETIVQTPTTTPASFPSSGCSGIYCATPSASAQARWNDASFSGWTATTTGVSDAAQAPQAIVEYMGTGPGWAGCMQETPPQPDCVQQRYRVTARSSGTDRATVILQTDDATP